MRKIMIPKGRLCSNNSNQDSPEEKARREEIRRRLLRGEETVVTRNGQLVMANGTRTESGIKTPPGKLA